MMRSPVAGVLYRLFRSDSRIATTEDLAATIGADRSTAYRWTNGETDPGTGILVRIMDAYPEARLPLHAVLFGRYGLEAVPDASAILADLAEAEARIVDFRRRLGREPDAPPVTQPSLALGSERGEAA